MAKNTPKKRPARQPRKPTVKDAVEKIVTVVLTPEEAYNTLILLNRVPTQGMQEAALLVTLGQKLHLIKGDFEVPKNG